VRLQPLHPASYTTGGSRATLRSYTTNDIALIDHKPESAVNHTDSEGSE